MNKVKLRSLLVEEVTNSNMSELVKGLIVEMLDNDRAADEGKEVTAKREKKTRRADVSEEGGMGEQRVIRIAPMKRQTRKFEHKDWDKLVEESIGIIENKKNMVSASKLLRKLGLIGGNAYKLKELLIKTNRVKKIMVGRRIYFARINQAEPKTKHEKPMSNKRSFRSKYMSERTKAYMKQGMAYLDAAKLASVDYSRVVSANKAGIVKYEFPIIDSVREDLRPLLKDVLIDIYKRDKPIKAEDLSGLLDGVEIDVFISEIIRKSFQIAKSLNIDKNLIWTDGKLRWG